MRWWMDRQIIVLWVTQSLTATRPMFVHPAFDFDAACKGLITGIYTVEPFGWTMPLGNQELH